MHPYSRDFNHTAWIHVVLAVIAVALYLGLSQLGLSQLPYLKSLSPIARYWFFNSPLTAVTIFLLLETLFDHWIWKLLSTVPFLHWENFAGRYTGEIRTGEGATHPATFQIRQTWSHIEIDLESGRASSKSFSAAIIKDRLRRGQIELIYNYYAQARRHGDLGAHYGTAMLKLADHGSELTGDYFTEQDRNSYGTIAIRRESRRSHWLSLMIFLLIAGVVGGLYYWMQLRH